MCVHTVLEKIDIPHSKGNKDVFGIRKTNFEMYFSKICRCVHFE
jgi:hypothetical protein